MDEENFANSGNPAFHGAFAWPKRAVAPVPEYHILFCSNILERSNRGEWTLRGCRQRVAFSYHVYGRRTGLKIRPSQEGVGSVSSFAREITSVAPFAARRVYVGKSVAVMLEPYDGWNSGARRKLPHSLSLARRKIARRCVRPTRANRRLNTSSRPYLLPVPAARGRGPMTQPLGCRRTRRTCVFECLPLCENCPRFPLSFPRRHAADDDDACSTASDSAG